MVPSEVDDILSLLTLKLSHEYSVDDRTLKTFSEVCESVETFELIVKIAVSRRTSRIHTHICRFLLESIDEYIVARPAALRLLLATYPHGVVSLTPYTYLLSSKDSSCSMGLNLYGFMLTLYRDRFINGVGVLGSVSSNAIAVARMHHTYRNTRETPMIGTALPGLSEKFDPSSFPSTSREAMDDSNRHGVEGEKRKKIARIEVTGPDSFRDIDIEFGEAYETTPTRNNRTSTRYWKAQVFFVRGNIRTTTLSVPETYVLKKGKSKKPKGPDQVDAYGTDFANISIPKYVKDALQRAMLPKYPNCSLDEPKLAPSDDRWFKTVNHLSDLFTVITTDAKGMPETSTLSFGPTVDRVQCGVRVSLEMEVSVKMKGDPGPGADINKLAHGVEVYPTRGRITKVDAGEIEMPRFVGTQQSRAKATDLSVKTTDVTPDAVLEEMRLLGLSSDN